MSKVALIGCGAVGCSFLYSALNQGLANFYGLMDAFEGAAIGNALDLEDAVSSLLVEAKIKKIDYSDLKDVDYILIAAGRPQAAGETRLNMVKDNVKIFKDIATKIKASGFKGITLIASNPVDVMTYAYIKYTGFDKSKVIGSGTALDSARLKIEISKDLGVSPTSVHNAFVIGEHGDSSVTTYSNICVANKHISEHKSSFTAENYEEKLEKYVARKAYTIIEKKRATFYGIGAAMARILRAIVEDKNEILAVGAMLSGEYGFSNIVLGTPCIINRSGIAKIIELNLNEKEKVKLENSYRIVDQINKESVI